MIQYLIILIILKVRHPGIRKHTADSVDGAQFLCICLPHGIQVEIEMAADHLRVCKADPRDSETKDQPRQCGWKISSNSWMNPAAMNFSSVISERPSIFKASRLTNRSKLLIFFAWHSGFVQ